jgi:hypothetical protein
MSWSMPGSGGRGPTIWRCSQPKASGRLRVIAAASPADGALLMVLMLMVLLMMVLLLTFLSLAEAEAAAVERRCRNPTQWHHISFIRRAFAVRCLGAGGLVSSWCVYVTVGLCVSVGVYVCVLCPLSLFRHRLACRASATPTTRRFCG